MTKSTSKARFQSGNVLFIILIAVMLFAALTYADTNSGRGGSNSDRERGTINATDYMAYGSGMEKAVARILSDDVSEGALSFENTIWQQYDGTQVETAAMFAACTETKCKVFDPAGGGLSPRQFPQQSVDGPVNGDIRSGDGVVYALKVTGVGTTAHDLVLMIAGIDKNTCLRTNDALDITNPSGNPPADAWGGAVRYAGSSTGPNDATDEIGDTATQITDKSAGCINRSGGAYGSADNYFYQVLLPR